jgi:hypothetical protein
VGTFNVRVTISNPNNPALSTTTDCLVDARAAYSQMPRSFPAGPHLAADSSSSYLPGRIGPHPCCALLTSTVEARGAN